METEVLGLNPSFTNVFLLDFLRHSPWSLGFSTRLFLSLSLSLSFISSWTLMLAVQSQPMHLSVSFSILSFGTKLPFWISRSVCPLDVKQSFLETPEKLVRGFSLERWNQIKLKASQFFLSPPQLFDPRTNWIENWKLRSHRIGRRWKLMEHNFS